MNSLIEPIADPLLTQQNEDKEKRPEKKGKRVAVIAGYGSKTAVASARKMDELLKLDNKRKEEDVDEINCETILMADEQPLDPRKGDIKPIAKRVVSVMNSLDDYDSLVVYLCLRRTRWNPNLTPLIDPVTGGVSRRGKQKTEPHKLKNYLLILDLEHPVDLSTDPFHGLPEGVAVLTMNGEDKSKASRNGKYTIFSGFLIEALKGGAADSYGMITLANLFSYLHEACMTEPSFRPTLKMLGSESLLLRRKDGILTKQQIQVFYDAFRLKSDEGKLVNVRLKKELLTLDGMPILLDRLVYLNLIAPCKFLQDEAKIAKGLSHQRPIVCLSDPTLSVRHEAAIRQGFLSRIKEYLRRRFVALRYKSRKYTPQVKKYDAYYLTPRGKHLLNMWDHFYFKFT